MQNEKPLVILEAAIAAKKLEKLATMAKSGRDKIQVYRLTAEIHQLFLSVAEAEVVSPKRKGPANAK